MSDYSTRNIIDYAFDADGTKFRDELYGSIHDRISAHIDAKKQEIARGLVGQNEEVEGLDEKVPEGYQDREGKLIPKIHPKMTPHEHGYDYTYQSIEDAPSKSSIHSQHKEILKDNPHPKASKEYKEWEAGTHKAKDDVLKDHN